MKTRIFIKGRVSYAESDDPDYTPVSIPIDEEWAIDIPEGQAPLEDKKLWWDSLMSHLKSRMGIGDRGKIVDLSLKFSKIEVLCNVEWVKGHDPIYIKPKNDNIF